MIKALASVKGEGAACGSGLWFWKDLNSFDAGRRSVVWKLRIANGLCYQKEILRSYQDGGEREDRKEDRRKESNQESS